MRLCPVCQQEYADDTPACPTDGSELMALEEAAPEADPLLGTIVDGRYQVERILGVGGMGAVYQAVQITMGRPIALKVLRHELASDAETVKRFLREVQAVSLLTHPNTITVFDFGQTAEGLLYIAMEFLPGRPLSDALAEGPRTVDEALRIVHQVSGALGEAHDKGIVHRDMKPDNVYLAEIGGQADQVKVLDFGIAKVSSGEVQTQLTQAGFTLGTPAYMAPEQAMASDVITPQADIYALGCILYECLAGRPPFVDESTVTVMMAHCSEEVPALSSVRPDLAVPPDVDALVRAMLEKDPALRPQTARDVQERIEVLRTPSQLDAPAAAPDPSATPGPSAAPGPPTPVPPPTLQPDLAGTTSQQATPPRRRFPVVPVALGGLLAVGAVAVVLATGGETGQPAVPPPAAAPAPVRSIWLRSTPAGAKVVESGERLGRTPLRIEVDPERVRRLSLRLKGYASLAVAVDPGLTDDVSVALARTDPAAPAATARPARAPKAKKRKRRPRKRKPAKTQDDGDGELFAPSLK